MDSFELYGKYRFFRDGTAINIRTGKTLKPQLISANSRPLRAMFQLYDENGKLKQHVAHTTVWKGFNGPLNQGLVIRHVNNNPWDNNVENLTPGTHADNMRDKKISGRAYKKLSLESSDEIRKRYLTGNVTQLELSKTFGVGTTMISYIIRNLRNTR